MKLATLILVVALAGCGDVTDEPPPVPPPAPADCPLTATDLRDGIGLFACADAADTYICYGEFTTPSEGCLIYPGEPTAYGKCVPDCRRTP